MKRLLMEGGMLRLNGLGSPMGIETDLPAILPLMISLAKWPGKPDGD